MNAYEIPNLRFSVPVTGATKVMENRLVSVDANGGGITANATSTVIGASRNRADVGEVLEIADGIVMVVAGEDVTAGQPAYADANGKVVGTGTIKVGTIITSAVTDGLATVKL